MAAPAINEVTVRQVTGDHVEFSIYGARFHYRDIQLTAPDGTFLGNHGNAGQALDAALFYFRRQAGAQGVSHNQQKGG